MNVPNADMSGVSQQIRDYLIGYLRVLKRQRVVISTSGGIDSSALVVAALEAGCDVTVSSFTLDDRTSEDFRSARKLAQYFNLEFKPIYLPVDPEIICDEVIRYMGRYKVRRKADVECVYPVAIQMSQLATGTHYVSGLWADGHFCLSKKGMIHYRSTKELYQKFRYEYFYVNPHHQRAVFRSMANNYNLKYHEPFWSMELYNIMMDLSWDEANKPRQKEVLRAAFPELNPLRIKNHTNLQLGDSGIAEAVGKAMLAKYAPTGKSSISAYNAVVRRGILEAYL